MTDLPQDRGSYRFGPYQLDITNRLLIREGKIVHLKPKAFDLLLVLVRRNRKVVPKSELMKAVWAETIVEDGILPVNIKELRNTLQNAESGHGYIQNFPRKGYMFVAKVTYSEEEASIDLGIENSSASNGSKTGTQKTVTRVAILKIGDFESPLWEILKKVNKLSGDVPDKDESSNMYYAAFQDAQGAIQYGLEVRDALRYYDWRAEGWARTPLFRIAIALPNSADASGLDAIQRLLEEVGRIDPAPTRNEVWVSQPADSHFDTRRFYLHSRGNISQNEHLFIAYCLEEETAVCKSHFGPLLDEQHDRRAEALRRFAYVWLVLDQLPAGGWGRSTSGWMKEVWRDMPAMLPNPLMDDEGGFETAVLNLHLMAGIVGLEATLQGIGGEAVKYIQQRHGPRGFGTMSLSRHGYGVEAQSRHTALVAWLLGTAFKEKTLKNPSLRELFKDAASDLLAGDPKSISKEFDGDRNPLLLYLAGWHVAREVGSKEWSRFFPAEKRDRMLSTWQHCEEKLLKQGLRENYEDAAPSHLRSAGEWIYPLTIPYGGFVRMEAYSLLSAVMLAHEEMPEEVRLRLGDAIRWVMQDYLENFFRAERRYTRDPLRPKVRGPKPYYANDEGLEEEEETGRPAQTHPDLGTAGMLVRILRSPSIVRALWGDNVPSRLAEVRYLLTEDLTELFDRYLIHPRLYALTHPGMLAGIFAGDHPSLKEATRVRCKKLTEHLPSSELKGNNLENVLSERHIESLVDEFVAGDPIKSSRIQMATHSVARLLLDKLRPGRYLKETLSDDGIKKVSQQTCAVYQEPTFAEKYDQRWGTAADKNISAPFLGLIGERAAILDVGSGPGQYAAEFTNTQHKVDLVDVSEAFLEKARIRVKNAGGALPEIFCGNILDHASRPKLPKDKLYDAIWCSAFLVHVPLQMIPEILHWFSSVLRPQGTLFANVMVGNPRVFARDGRYFSYIASAEQFERMLLESGFQTDFMLKKALAENTYGEPVLETLWANFYARKGAGPRRSDIGTTAALLTSLAYQRSVEDFRKIHQHNDAIEKADQLASFVKTAHPRVLDAGCGPGDYVMEMAHRKWHAIGIDISDHMIATAQKRSVELRKYASFQVGDMRLLPAGWTASFDAIICVSALQHVPKKDGHMERALREFWRALSPRGILRIDVRIGCDAGYDPDLRFIQTFSSEKEILPLLEEIGFEQVGDSKPRELGIGDNSFRRPIKVEYVELWLRKK
jgi:DNA-binding winged helix-turn-helix (wHTH) protein/ubiquinone/menaquinone biosynthesis C-methylase UbiE